MTSKVYGQIQLQNQTSFFNYWIDNYPIAQVQLSVMSFYQLDVRCLFGGFGTIIGTLLGALSIAVIQNGLILSHISPFYTQIATGTIILLAIWLNTRILNPTRSAAKG